MHRIFAIITALVLLSGCTPSAATSGKESLYVTILPLKSLVERLTCGDFKVEVLVPKGASAETYEPTPRQIVGLKRSEVIFSTGLIDFENSLTGKIEEEDKVVNLSRGIALIAGSCSHTHTADGEAHGIDPHIWTSPKALKVIAANIREKLAAMYPDSTRYAAAYEKLSQEIETLDRETARKISDSGIGKFIIYHPALTYYARDYGIEQIEIEQDGKELSARRLSRIIHQAKQEGIRKVFYQCQFPESAVEAIVRDIDGTAVEIDPLREDVVQNIREITDLIIAQ